MIKINKFSLVILIGLIFGSLSLFKAESVSYNNVYMMISDQPAELWLHGPSFCEPANYYDFQAQRVDFNPTTGRLVAVGIRNFTFCIEWQEMFLGDIGYMALETRGWESILINSLDSQVYKRPELWGKSTEGCFQRIPWKLK